MVASDSHPYWCHGVHIQQTASFYSNMPWAVNNVPSRLAHLIYLSTKWFCLLGMSNVIYFVLFSRPNPVYQDSYQDSDGETATSSAKKKFAAPPAVNFPGKVVTLSTVTSVLSSVRSPTPTLSIAVYNSTYLSIQHWPEKANKSVICSKVMASSIDVMFLFSVWRKLLGGQFEPDT